MLHKQIHNHAKKHVKIAHDHIQEHGHKWLWILSILFTAILVYPYFSNAQDIGTDSCENWAIDIGTCAICPQWYIIDEAQQCIQQNNEETQEENNEEIQEENNEEIQEENNTTGTCILTIQKPISWDIVGWDFSIQWVANNNCIQTETINIDIRDHNQQWITIGTTTIQAQELVFSSTWLATTWLYTITGFDQENNLYTIYTGAYSGNYTDFATWYKIRIIKNNNTIVAETNDIFTIDNKKPSIMDLYMSFSNVISWYVWKIWTGTITFTSDESITWTVFSVLWTTVIPTTYTQNNNTYTYTIPLNKIIATWAIALTATVKDIAWNENTIYGTSTIIFDNQIPKIWNFSVTGWVGWVSIKRETDKQTKFNFSYTKSGTENTFYYTGRIYNTKHQYTITNTKKWENYIFQINVSDILENTKTLWWDIDINQDGVVSIGFNQNSIDILPLSPEAESELYLKILEAEVAKFQACKAWIILTQQDIPIMNKKITLQIPTINKNMTKQTMTAFLLLFTNKVKLRTDLSQQELGDIANIINNFLVVLKLTDDDNNACQQSMSNYYIGVFESMMTNMNFF